MESQGKGSKNEAAMGGSQLSAIGFQPSAFSSRLLALSESSATLASRMASRRVGDQLSRNQNRRRSIDVGKQALEILDFRQIVDDDVGIGGVPGQKVLVIGLGRIERVT
jgi:hypothetical protein